MSAGQHQSHGPDDRSRPGCSDERLRSAARCWRTAASGLDQVRLGPSGAPVAKEQSSASECCSDRESVLAPRALLLGGADALLTFPPSGVCRPGRWTHVLPSCAFTPRPLSRRTRRCGTPGCRSDRAWGELRRDHPTPVRFSTCPYPRDAPQKPVTWPSKRGGGCARRHGPRRSVHPG